MDEDNLMMPDMEEGVTEVADPAEETPEIALNPENENEELDEGDE